MLTGRAGTPPSDSSERPCSGRTINFYTTTLFLRRTPTRLMMPKMRPPRENMVRYSPSRLFGTGVILASACERT